MGLGAGGQEREERKLAVRVAVISEGIALGGGDESVAGTGNGMSAG
jgi:hypothetical protein